MPSGSQRIGSNFDHPQLRARAESAIGAKSAGGDIQHELDVHRAELQLQNEELVDTRLQLERSQREYFALFDLAPVGYLTLNDRGVIQRINAAAAELIGSDRSSMMEKAFTSHLSDGQARPFFDHLARVLGTKQAGHCELALKDRGGRAVWVAMHSTPAPKAARGDEALFCTLTDISARVRASTALDLSEARLRAIVENAGAGILLTDAEGRVLESSGRAERLFGETASALEGRQLADLIDVPGDAALAEAIARSTKSRATTCIQLTVSGRAGRREVRDTVSCVELKEAPDSLHLVHLLEDVTEEVRAKAEERRLQEQVQAAESDKLRSLGQLAGGIAHDINNMLAVITSSSEAMQLFEELPEDASACVDDILEATKRARSLVQQVLTFARRREFSLEPLDLARVVESSLRLIRTAAPATVDVELVAEQRPTVLADPVQIQQVLMNLATNAYHAMEGRGGGTLRIVVGESHVFAGDDVEDPELFEGTYARIAVSDTGLGMEPAIRARAFEPYFTTRETLGGHGMGLAMAHGIVKQHGGSIGLTSALGHGTTVAILLPLAVEKTKTPEDPEPSALWSGSVMLVEDSDLLRISTARILDALGCRVSSFGKADEALAAFRANGGIDVVVADHQMPGMTGLELAKQLRLESRVPIILLVGNANALDAQQVQALGQTMVLDKPATRRELHNALGRMMKKEGAR